MNQETFEKEIADINNSFVLSKNKIGAEDVEFELPTQTKLTPYNSFTGQEYTGENVIILLAANYGCREWATFLQWNEHGYKVIKGSKGTVIARYIEVDKINPKTGKQETDFIVKHYTLFSRDQVEKITNN